MASFIKGGFYYDNTSRENTTSNTWGEMHYNYKRGLACSICRVQFIILAITSQLIYALDLCTSGWLKGTEGQVVLSSDGDIGFFVLYKRRNPVASFERVVIPSTGKRGIIVFVAKTKKQEQVLMMSYRLNLNVQYKIIS